MRAEESVQDLLLNDREKLYGDGLEDDSANATTKQKGINFLSIFRIFRRNALLISGITLAGVGVAALTSSGPPQYEGNFSILVEPITSQARSTDPSAISRALPADDNSIDYPTLLQVLQSPELLSKIAGEIQSRYPDVTAGSLQAEILNKNLVVQRPGTNFTDTAKVVDVKYQGSDPQRVQYILQKLADGFLKFSLEYRKSRIGGGVQFIEDQLPGLQQRVNSLEAELQGLKQRYRITDPAAEGTALSEQLRTAQTTRSTTQRELAEQQALYQRLQRQLGNLPPEVLLQAASLSENPRYQALLTQLQTIEAQIAVKSARYTEDSEVIKSLRSQQANLKQLIDVETGKNLGESTSVAGGSPVLAFQNPTRLDLIKQYIAAGNLVQQLQIRNQAVGQTEAFLDQRLQQYPAVSRRYTNLQQQLEIANGTLKQFLTQRETLRIEAAQKELPWEIISPPAIARDEKGNPAPTPVKTSRNMAMGAIAGLVLGFAAALLREKRKDIFFTTDDVQGVLGLPLLGAIPYREGSNPIMNPLAGNSDTFSKAFSSLYTNIRFLSPNSQVRSLVIGSAGAGDGKTTISLNLALAAAAMGQRVLLVDSNLRAPTLHNFLTLSNGVGLSEVLTGKATVGDAIHQSSLDRNLAVITAGQPSVDSIRALGTDEMKDVMSQLRSSFDLVVLDTPDLSEFPDAKFLGALTNGILLAVGIGRTKRSVLSQVMVELNRFNLPILGTVTNQSARSVEASYAQSRKDSFSNNGQPAILENLGILKPDMPTSTKR